MNSLGQQEAQLTDPYLQHRYWCETNEKFDAQIWMFIPITNQQIQLFFF